MSEGKIQSMKTIKWPEPLEGMKSTPFDVSQDAIQNFEQLISGDASETQMHQFLDHEPFLLRYLLNRTGHHGMWYVNKPQIRPPLINGEKGKILDFLVAGRNSDGYSWFVIELKSPKDHLFNQGGDSFSPVANKGLNQLALYLKYANEHQITIRDTLKIPKFNTPRGVLVIGKEEEINNQNKKDLKAFWSNELIKIEIISYSRILRSAKEHFHHLSQH